jgi:hypothetical protein
MTEWLKDCEICNAGLCSEMDKLTGEHNLSQRTAAAQLAKVVEDRLGYPLYSADTLRKRYQRHTNKLGRNVPPAKKTSSPRSKTPVNLVERIQKKEKLKKSPEIGQWLRGFNEDMHFMAAKLEAAKTYLESPWGLEAEVRTDFVTYGLRLRDAVLALFPEEEEHNQEVITVK